MTPYMFLSIAQEFWLLIPSLQKATRKLAASVYYIKIHTKAFSSNKNPQQVCELVIAMSV